MDERCCELTECYFVDGFFNFEQPVLTASRVKGLITREGLGGAAGTSSGVTIPVVGLLI